MGLLEELIVLVKESIDDANERKRPRQALPDSPEAVEQMRRAFARQEAQQRAAEAAENAAHLQAQQAEQAEQVRKRQLAEQERQRQRQRQPATVVHHVGAVDARRVTRLLRLPQTLREMIVMREILDKPLALRRHR